jgi:hypothetical protein
MKFAPRSTLGLIALLIFPGHVRVSGEPLPPPQIVRVVSRNFQFEAESDPETKETVVYRLDDGPQGGSMRGAMLWKFPKWFRGFELSNDGEIIVAQPDSLNLLPPDTARDDYVLLSFISRGKLIREITLKQLLGSRSKLRPTSDGVLWGHLYRQDETGSLILVDTVIGFLIFDIHSAKCVFPPNNSIDPPAAR